jgi:hypothetical protein
MQRWDDGAAPETSGANVVLTAGAAPVNVVPATVRHGHRTRIPTRRSDRRPTKRRT